MSGFSHNPALVPPGLAPAERTGRAGATEAPRRARPLAGPSFDELLRQQAGKLEFSGHAVQRIERRGIDLGHGTLERLTAGVERAASKGSRESVVFVDGTAFVVSVRNRTVITAVDREHMREHVFTNIDSAVIA
ncbi:MAG: flagellar biosynthesis protein [Thermoleophilaceae bacterium]|nr:flagellar biosynthesis protein [Thermoleophilaceae bacterium]